MKKCPKCQGTDLVLRETNPDVYMCNRCKMLTDLQDDGTVGYGSQSRHAERKEEYEIRKRQREQKRGRRW